MERQDSQALHTLSWSLSLHRALEWQKGNLSPLQIVRYADQGAVPVELCRLGYLGLVEEWAYAFYKYSDDCYAPSTVSSGRFTAAPEQCFDTSAGYTSLESHL